MTSRFTQSLVVLASAQLEDTLMHANFAQGFERSGKRIEHRRISQNVFTLYLAHHLSIRVNFGLERSTIPLI